MWAPNQFMDSLYKKTLKDNNVYTEDWKQNVIVKLRESLGDFGENDISLEPNVIEEKDFEDYSRLRIEITTLDQLKMPVYVLKPKGSNQKKLPAVLAIHGHGYGSKEVVGLLPDGTENEGNPGIHKNFAVELVRKGFIVFAPELIGFGDRKMSEDHPGVSPNDNSCYTLASHLLLYGKTLPGLRIYECSRVIDFIMTMEEIDQGKIGCMGLSGGGLVAAYTSVLDDRVKATVISGYTNTFKGSIMDRRHCLDNYIPGVLQYAEMPELIGLSAPRPLFIESGISDHLFPKNEVEIAIKRITEIYKQFHAENLIDHHFFQGGHEINGEKSYDWLANVLQLAERR
ncbi:dienelactone hydrolase family protein [Evansella sp. AB-rgal1]|uniref:dienelactone hydrolase family protein n=1 Tax=Evansella sp. AB-rgal1 TaxID=3242696 RepID=UPI00359E527A